MSYKQTTICISAGKNAPDDFFETILKDFPHTAGFAAPIENDGLKSIVMFTQAESPPMDEIQSLMKEYEFTDRYLSFGKFPDQFSENSIQPFITVKDADDNVVLVTLIDGNFDERIVEGSNESGEAAVHEEYIVSAYKRIFKGAGGDVDEFMKEVMTDPSIPKTMELLYKGRGSIVQVCSNGEFIKFGVNALHSDFDWGWASNPGSYKEAGTEPAKVSLLDKAKNVAKASFSNRPAPTKPAVAAAAAAATAAAPKPSSGGNARTEAARQETVVHNKSGPMAAPPAWATTKNQVQSWYMEHNGGIVPADWRQRPKVIDQRPERESNAMTKALADIKPVDQSRFKKEVEAELLPVVSPQSMTYVHEVFLKKASVQKVISEGKTVLDIKRVKQTEEEFTSALEIMGFTGYQQMYGIEQEDWAELIERAPDLIRVLLTNLLYEDYKVQQAIDGALPTKTPATPTKTTTTPTKPGLSKPTSFANRKTG